MLLILQPLPVVRLRQLVAESGHLRHSQPRLPTSIPADPLLPVWIAEPHDARGVLSVTVW